jgi:hypothetical protein
MGDYRKFLVFGVAALSLAFLPGCASLAKPADKASVIFEHPLIETHKAAEAALAVCGFQAKRTEPNYLQGERPLKVGFFVGSGGESAGIWMEPVTEQRTRVWVKSVKSLVGYLGQKNWDDELLAEMTKFAEQRRVTP